MPRKKNLLDYPTISFTQAANIFMWSPRKFREHFRQVLQFEVRHVSTARGVRLLLEDIIRAAYPDASTDKVCELAYDYTMRDVARRRDTWGRTKARKQDKDEGP